MNRVPARVFATLVSLSMVSPISVSQARIFDLKEQVIYTDAFSDFVKNYDKASEQYKAKGPTAFIETIAPKRSESDKSYLKKTLGSLPKLPKVTSDQALLIIDATESDGGVHTVEVSNIDDGMLIVDGNPVEFDSAKVDLEIISKRIERSLDHTTTKVSAFDSWSNLFIRPAYAKKQSMWLWAVVGAIGGAATVWVMDWWSNRDTKKAPTVDENAAAAPAPANGH